MSTVADLIEATGTWDGSARAAGGLRALAAAVPPLRGRPPEGGRAVARIVALHHGRGKGGTGALVRWLADEAQADQRAAAAPLVGDPALSPWPWEQPYTVDPATAIAASQLLEHTPIVIDDAVRRFLRTMVRERRRSIWRPAARALGAAATRDEVLREELRATVASELPHHLWRHLLVAQASYVASGGAVDGLPIADLPSRKLPTDDADQSVVLRAAVLLLHSTMGPSVRDVLPRWSRSMGVGPQSEAAARTLVDALPADASGPLRARLIARRWRSHDADALQAWLQTAAWFQAAGDAEAVAAIRANAGRAERALDWTLGGGIVGPEDLVHALQHALSPTRWALAPPAEWTVGIAEALALMERPELAELPWPAVEVATGLELGGLDGTVGEVGATGLALALGRRGRWLPSALRRSTWSRDAVLARAQQADGYLVAQVALQAERVLREPDVDEPGESVRFLWLLLLADPPTRTFSELARMLRDDRPLPEGTGTNAPLKTLVTAMRDLDEARDAGQPRDVIEALLRVCLDETHAVLPPAVAQRLKLDALAADLAEEGSWSTHLHRVVLGREGVGGLIALHGWLAGLTHETLQPQRLRLEHALEQVGRAQRRLEEARPWAGSEHHRGAVVCADALEAELGLSWPLAHPPLKRLEALRAAAHAARDEGRDSQALVDQVVAAMQRGDEEAVRTLVQDAERRSRLPPRTLRLVHRFLLDQLLWLDARRLRADASEVVSLPPVSGWLLPLLLAVCGGTFVVLDVGEAWLGLADRESMRMHYSATIGLTLVGAYGVLVAALGARLRVGHGGSWARAALRVAPLFLLAAALAGAASGLAIATLGQDWARWPLWSSLSLFLGMFVGLVLQGQGLTRPDDDHGR